MLPLGVIVLRRVRLYQTLRGGDRRPLNTSGLAQKYSMMRFLIRGFQKTAVEVTPLYFLDEIVNWLPETEFPVSRSISVPSGQWRHPPF